MKPSVAFECLKVLVYARLPGFMWGEPGICKSSLAKALASYFFVIVEGVKNTFALIDERAVLRDPTDVKGIPHINGDGQAHWCPPATYPKGGYGIFLIDELLCAPPLTQSAYLQLILDRCIGDYRLPDGWFLLAASNPERSGAVVHRMSSALANRFVHLQIEPGTADWIRWAKNGHQEEAAEYKALEFSPITAESRAFVQFRPEQLHGFNADTWNQTAEKAYPTPRTNEFADRIMQACDRLGTDKQIRFELLKGCCGEAYASERLAFRKLLRDLPDPVATLANPAQAPVPQDPSVIIALTAALVDQVTPETAENFMTYATRLPEEFSMKMVKEAELDEAKRKMIANTVGYLKWATQNRS